MKGKSCEVYPISEEDLKRIRNYFKKKKVVLGIINIGVNVALRFSDLTSLKFEYIKENKAIIKEKKTGKIRTVYLNKVCLKEIEDLKKYYKEREIKEYDKGYIFKSLVRKYLKSETDIPMRIQSFNRILSEAQKELKLEYNIGSHSLRKTWGNIVYHKYRDIGTIMKALNHSSESSTLRYIGIVDEELENLFQSIEI